MLSDEDRAAGWREWAGGECPVPAGTPVEFRNRGGGSDTVENSFNLIWNWYGKTAAWHIIAYRIAGENQRAAAATDSPSVSAESPSVSQQSAAHHSETPKTDALLRDMVPEAEHWAITDLARTLEREAAALRRELADGYRALGYIIPTGPYDEVPPPIAEGIKRRDVLQRKLIDEKNAMLYLPYHGVTRQGMLAGGLP